MEQKRLRITALLSDASFHLRNFSLSSYMFSVHGNSMQWLRSIQRSFLRL